MLATTRFIALNSTHSLLVEVKHYKVMEVFIFQVKLGPYVGEAPSTSTHSFFLLVDVKRHMVKNGCLVMIVRRRLRASKDRELLFL